MQITHKDFVIPENLPVSELERLRGRLEDTIAERREREKEVAAQRIKELIDETGFQVDDLLPLLQRSKPLPVRYRHPENPELTWCGKGRRPLWMTEALSEGLTLDQMAA